MLSERYGLASGLPKGKRMKVSIEVGHGWVAAMSKCDICGYEFTLIRRRGKDHSLMRCPVCKNNYAIKEQETPWVGLIEEMK